ncbi:hypothetical protein DDB_G0269622 [Dictyostelium discoideum AX4]|uniref:Transmembrane protein n=1 Tax=Dictyostelium discoideum TaxID=44689 RepID=Q55DK8_DICDI|nr:hypothetical protein DDB_G0269622 [Dictyostelium discoideum AX4]EAL72161.1 hypothetical protein DDB_G0269622 [Dictyostelium discoideum AX4]|eukprot:XP_646123.1 hypothetical protein DDB_G0269622 [Dictyostelium discoideum AX4]
MNSNNNGDNNDSTFNQEFQYNFEYGYSFKNENLDFIIQPQLQQFYQQQYQQQQQQQNNNYNSSNNNKDNNHQTQSHQLINIIDPFQRDKIVLRKRENGLFSTTDNESSIPPTILPMSRFYEVVDEINHYYEKEFFIYNRLIKVTLLLTMITIMLSLVLFLTTDIQNENNNNKNNNNFGAKGKHSHAHAHHNKSKENAQLSIRFLLPLSMSIIFLIFYLITSYIRYVSCPKNMEDYCEVLSNRFSNLSFSYYSGEWGYFEKITIKFPRIHIHPVVYIYVDHNKIENKSTNDRLTSHPSVDKLFS